MSKIRPGLPSTRKNRPCPTSSSRAAVDRKTAVLATMFDAAVIRRVASGLCTSLAIITQFSTMDRSGATPAKTQNEFSPTTKSESRNSKVVATASVLPSNPTATPT